MAITCGHYGLAPCLALILSHSAVAWAIAFPWSSSNESRFDYDVVVIGAGASGLFASGSAAGFGKRTLLIERVVGDYPNLGGDCTNNACVPSKALRSASRASAALSRTMDTPQPVSVRQFVTNTVNKVRKREDAEDMANRNPNLSVEFVKNVFFLSPHKIQLELLQSKPTIKSNETETTLIISSRQFLIATGAGPIMPPDLVSQAAKTQLNLLNYQTLLCPPEESSPEARSFWNSLPNTNLLVAGGGPTAMELSQSLARLGVNVTVIATEILPDEDESARRTAIEILKRERVNWMEGRVVAIHPSNSGQPRVVTNSGTTVATDYMLLALGRSPAMSLSTLALEKARIQWSDRGVHVNRYLQSTSSKHVFACGDCASIIDKRDRRASHAGWTGFHSVRSMLNPPLFRGGPLGSALHPFVPRVTFTDPEIGSIGMSHSECLEKYGLDGFIFLRANETGTDRADMDSAEQNGLDLSQDQESVGFVELRARKRDGRILGATVCSPSCAEIINLVGVALTNRLTCLDISRSLIVYPSHGYLLYRVALSLALSNVWGLLASCGPLGRFLGSIGRHLEFLLSRLLRPFVKSRKGRKTSGEDEDC